MKINGSLKFDDLSFSRNDDESFKVDEGQDVSDGKDDNYCLKKFPNPAGYKPLNFQITLLPKQWEKIKPDEVIYSDGRCYVFKKDWSDVIIDRIWEAEKITCSYAFKKHAFYRNSELPFFYFWGKCHECDNYIRGECSKTYNINSEAVVINIYTFNSKHVQHKKKRHLKGSNRNDAKRFLPYIKASRYRQEKANELMDYSELEPPILHNSIILRKTKQEAVDKLIKLSGPTQVLESFLFLQKNGFPAIREIYVNPFIVKYFTEEQLTVVE